MSMHINQIAHVRHTNLLHSILCGLGYENLPAQFYISKHLNTGISRGREKNHHTVEHQIFDYSLISAQTRNERGRIDFLEW